MKLYYTNDEKKNCIKKMINQIGWVAKVFKKI
jgi:hypothetical protein